jgi:hypothetical protein
MWTACVQALEFDAPLEATTTARYMLSERQPGRKKMEAAVCIVVACAFLVACLADVKKPF